MPTPQIAVALCDPRRLRTLARRSSLCARDLAAILGDAAATGVAPDHARATHLYWGSEFCEHLFPSDGTLALAADTAAGLNLTLVLLTPVANDALIARITRAVAKLPASAEIVVNDWGVACALHALGAGRTLIAGRQLAKMIKDPRTQSGAWATLYPASVGTRAYRGVLERFGITRVELDLAPFATLDTLSGVSGVLSLWAPYGYVAKGRLCKIGSLDRPRADKFAPGRACRRECLSITEALETPSGAGIAQFARGNSLYYRHTPAMAGTVREAVARGIADRLVLSGL